MKLNIMMKTLKTYKQILMNKYKLKKAKNKKLFNKNCKYKIKKIINLLNQNKSL